MLLSAAHILSDGNGDWCKFPSLLFGRYSVSRADDGEKCQTVMASFCHLCCNVCFSVIFVAQIQLESLGCLMRVADSFLRR